MSPRRMIAGILASAVMATAGAAVAAEATATANVRSGPGKAYAVVGVLHAGQPVDVDRCTSSGWCFVIKSGPDGWVAGRYLSDAETAGNGPDRPANPDVSITFSVPGFSFSFGDGGFAVRPPRNTGSVCFYEHVNYQGDRFCVRPGQDLRSLGSWNDQISSIDVVGGAQALICEDVDFRGRCVVVSRDVSNLGPRGNDRISSIRVR